MIGEIIMWGFFSAWGWFGATYIKEKVWPEKPPIVQEEKKEIKNEQK
jgi:hypothetical protein